MSRSRGARTPATVGSSRLTLRDFPSTAICYAESNGRVRPGAVTRKKRSPSFIEENGLGIVLKRGAWILFMVLLAAISLNSYIKPVRQ